MLSREGRLILTAVLAACGSVTASLSYAADVGPVKAPPLAKPVSDIPFFLVNDNRLTYAYMFNDVEPGYYQGGYSPKNPKATFPRQTVAFTHFDVWAYGTNYVNISVSKATPDAPASPCLLPGIGLNFATQNCAGMTSLYGVERSTFGWNELFDTKTFQIGPMRNISFQIGADGSLANSYTGSQYSSWEIGLQFAFALPYEGYFNISPVYYKASNHSAYGQCGAAFVFGYCDNNGVRQYTGGVALEMNYYMDLGFLPEAVRYFSISGRASLYGKKKRIGSPVDTQAPWVDAEPVRLTFDASKAIWGKKYSHYLDVWVAYRYIQNKYGYDHTTDSSCTIGFITGGTPSGACTQSSVYAGVTMKF